MQQNRGSVLSSIADFAAAAAGGYQQGETIQNGWPRLCLCADTLQLYSTIAHVRVYRIHGRRIRLLAWVIIHIF